MLLWVPDWKREVGDEPITAWLGCWSSGMEEEGSGLKRGITEMMALKMRTRAAWIMGEAPSGLAEIFFSLVRWELGDTKFRPISHIDKKNSVI